MKLEEYNKIKNLNYRQYCTYLQDKYGKAQYDYMTRSFNKNQKVTRTKEGLYCHHIFEDTAILLGEKQYAEKNPYEYQLAENLCYCDLLEHLLLHILICENPSPNKNKFEAVGIGGVMNYFIPELNDVYSGWESRATWQQNCHNIIKNDKAVYIELIKRTKKLEGYPLYREEDLYKSAGQKFGIWSNEKNMKLYEELKNA